MNSSKMVPDGTNEIADRFEAITAGSQVAFAAPADVSQNWLPNGYELVTDPNHVLRADDALLPVLGTDWRLVGGVNGGGRIGLRAVDVGSDIRYVAKRIINTDN